MKPLSLDYSYDEYKAPNMLQQALSLFKNIWPGSDPARSQLTPVFNIPKSQLQRYGESVYCTGYDMLGKCNSRNSPIERFKGVLAWDISILHPLIFGIAHGPILGETHHVSRGTLNVLLEQISLNPPASALHATDEKENLELVWSQYEDAKFCDTSLEGEVRGKKKLKLLNHGETYEMNSTNTKIIKFFPPGFEWGGRNQIRCHETGLEAELNYGGRSFLGLITGIPAIIKGKIFDSSSKKPLFEINGQLDRIVTLKDLKNGEVQVLLNAKEVISGLKTPIIKDPKGVWPSESAFVWRDVIQNIMSKDWAKAREAQKVVGEKQRELLRERESKSETWVPKHFIVSYSKENGWDCSPIEKVVPPAPIVVPLNS